LTTNGVYALVRALHYDSYASCCVCYGDDDDGDDGDDGDDEGLRLDYDGDCYYYYKGYCSTVEVVAIAGVALRCHLNVKC
jgi:hypothetical protein